MPAPKKRAANRGARGSAGSRGSSGRDDVSGVAAAPTTSPPIVRELLKVTPTTRPGWYALHWQERGLTLRRNMCLAVCDQKLVEVRDNPVLTEQWQWFRDQLHTHTTEAARGQEEEGTGES